MLGTATFVRSATGNQMSDIAAAMGLAGLAALPSSLAHRRRLFAAYVEGLRGVANLRIVGDALPADREHAAWLFTILVDDAASLRTKLREHRIEFIARPLSQRPVPTSSLLRAAPSRTWTRSTAITSGLPLHPRVTLDDVERICDVIRCVTPSLTFPVADQEEYQAWLAVHHPSPAELAAERAAATTLPLRPLISVVVPVFDSAGAFSARGAQVRYLDETYDRFELCLVDDGSRSPTVREVLDECAARDGRVRLRRHEANRGIVAASNSGLDLASGDFVAFLDHDDLLASSALFAIAALVASSPDADMIYTDEDKVDWRGGTKRAVLQARLVSGLVPVADVHLPSVGIPAVARGGDWALSHGLRGWTELRPGPAADRTNQPHPPHPEGSLPLAHALGVDRGGRQPEAYVYQADRRALQDAVDRRGEPGIVLRVPGELACYAVRYQILEPRKVSIVLPSRNQGEMLNTCLGSIFSRTTWTDFEVILVTMGAPSRALWRRLPTGAVASRKGSCPPPRHPVQLLDAL